ncbi:helix-turn-helix transcriptional regulator [Chromobacterium violaceum]|uniref:helix-turn-helix domain-containing protein n=1 Tax=Chromobacterium violaceum TaxID=536 RepID=UPI001B328FA2|nr:helix-turn-helix transcriptional regulator [Chromobacterium violaceum]MBP4050895.1 helix-turn-helix transcriptional regulator [Chromobacterium violaceum]
MQEANKKGKRLRVALKHALRKKGESISGLAAQQGISQSYLSQLLNGDKPIDGIDDDLLRKFAAYLEVPGVAVFILAERLTAADFLVLSPSLGERLSQAMIPIGQSSAAIESGVEEGTLAALPERMKLLLVLLHQQAYGVELLNPSRAWWFGGGRDK